MPTSRIAIWPAARRLLRWRAGSARHIPGSGGPTSGPSCAAHNSNVEATTTSTFGRAWFFALGFTGRIDEAIAASEGLIEAGAATENPYMHTFAAAASGFPIHTADPIGGLISCRRGLAIAQESGNRFNESILALNLARFEARQAVSANALDYVATSIGNYHHSGNTVSLRSPLAVLSSFFARLGRLEAAATIAGFSLSPLALASVPELAPTIAELRGALGDRAYESLAGKGEAMTMAAIVGYAYDQMDQARTALEGSP